MGREGGIWSFDRQNKPSAGTAAALHRSEEVGAWNFDGRLEDWKKEDERGHALHADPSEQPVAAGFFAMELSWNSLPLLWHARIPQVRPAR